MIGEALSGAISGALRGLGGASGVKLSVDQNNVLQAARIVKAEAEHFRGRISFWTRDMRVAPMGDDPVSIEVADVLNDKLIDSDTSYVTRCHEYAAMLDDLAEQLKQSALTYGFTEEQIRDVFVAAEHDAEHRATQRGPSRGHGQHAI